MGQFDSMQSLLRFAHADQFSGALPANGGTVSLVVARDSQAGPTVSIQLEQHLSGIVPLERQQRGGRPSERHSLIGPTSPAAPGEIVVIYAAGLGRTSPDTTGGQLATSAFPIYYLSQLQILLTACLVRRPVFCMRAGAGFCRSLSDQFAAPEM